MEISGKHPSTSRSPPGNSSVDLVDSSSTSIPLTPSLEPSSSRVTRRRSWGNRTRTAGISESPHLEVNMPTPSLSPRRHPSPLAMPGDDSEYLLAGELWGRTDSSDYSHISTGVTKDVFSYSQATPSTAMLMGSPGAAAHLEPDIYHGFSEDNVPLRSTSNPSHLARQESLDTYSTSDPEHEGAMPSRSQRKSLQYTITPSPLKGTENVMKSVSQNLKRLSLRVVNLRNNGLEGQVRLPDGEEERAVVLDEEQEEQEEDLKEVFPIRGRALGVLGPENKIRLALFKFLVHPVTEPVILILIILNAVILTIQSFPALTLPSANGPTLPPMIKGYFHTWEDYTLFVLFIVFTVEALARICATGFLFDPEVSMFSHFTPKLASSDTFTATASSLARQTSIVRGHSFKQRLKRAWKALLRPFALSGRPPSSPSTSAYPMSSLPRFGFHSGSNRNFNETSSRADTTHKIHTSIYRHPDPTFRSLTMQVEKPKSESEPISLPFRLIVNQIHDKTYRNVPYLRQSWTRIDFVAILSFWITFGLAIGGVERGVYHIGIFRAMSVMRTTRLLTITSGTTTIMHSLKIARPLIARVAYFVLFAMVLFSIIGVQSFKGSLRRACVISPTLGEDAHRITSQFCGGHVDPDTLIPTGYIQLNNQTFPSSKGYICPLGQLCIESDNPEQGIQSFDAIYASALQVVVVAGANNWSPVMYSVIDSDFFFSSLFFIIGIVVLNFWMLNLFVAVITNTFSAIRSETRKSAFGAASTISPFDKEKDDGWAMVEGRKTVRSNFAKTLYGYTTWLWVVLALAELVLQATRTVTVSPVHEMVMYYGELVITVAFDVEIGLRILAALPDWRVYFRQGNNWLDTVLAIGSTVIQLPLIRRSPLYPWFTVFQLMRFYRVILVVPRMKPLLLTVFGNMYGIANMVLFLLIINYISALIAIQLLRGDFGNDQFVTFGEVFNSFLAIYQVFTSENWTNVLYGGAIPEIPLGQAVIALLFVTAWFLFGNFIILQMFIAVINENFQVAEEQKKGKQASKYYDQQKARQGTVSWFRRLNPYRWIKPKPERARVANLPSNLVLPIQKTLVQDYNLSRSDSRTKSSRKSRLLRPQHYTSKFITALQQLFVGDSVRTNNIVTFSLRHHHTQESITDPVDEEIERHLEFLASVVPDAGLAEAEDEYYERRAQKADFIRNHPSYDRVFWFIGQRNPLRRLCQKIVLPARGDRIFGTPPSPAAHSIFQLIILLTIIGGIVVEGIATPLYRRNYFLKHGLSRGAWFEIAETTFGFVLFVEFAIKVIADGFLFTPNGYLFGIWNCLDFIIMIGIIVNITTGLIFIGGLSRLTRSLKALRALRLITLVDKMRNTFGTLIIYGAVQIIDAAILAILYMIPYAVWGLNIFNGLFSSCNDSSVGGLDDCVGEYVNTVYGNAFGFPAPRVWDYPSPSTTFSFDSFRSSLLILFEIVSLEGWVDVMQAAFSITGPNQQPQPYASPGNAIFFVVYNLLGGVVILTIFVSLIIGNFRAKTGADLLTQAQQEWIDLQKLFRRQRPSKRPVVQPEGLVRKWCFDRAVHKHGGWWIMMTVLFVLHIIVLMTQTFSANALAESFRNDFFLTIMLIYILDVSVRCYGLGWHSFKANGWNIFDIVVSIGSFVTTLAVRFGNGGFGSQQLQKLFLVSIAFKLVERTNSLNMLFKTAISSLRSILSLLGLWIVLFMFFAILYVEVFGLTRWGPNETHAINYYSLGNALLMLSFQSTGEGWNQFMHDFDLTYPRCTSDVLDKTESDCGSTAWAYSLFIVWNVLSMYIFVNMFVGVVVENFSYVFQTSGSGSKSITREQMRAFKKVWATYSNPKTGYLERSNFGAFFSKLSGVFEVRVYPLEFNFRNIASACKVTESDPKAKIPGLDLNKLRLILNDIDYKEIRKRRANYCRLYQEASISHEPGLGISFTNMLLLLAHHKLIVDAEALLLQDLVARTETNKLVTDLVDLDRVRSLLKTISLRRQFLKKRAKKFEKDIPSIVVQDMPETPPMSSRDIASAGLEQSPGSPTPMSKQINQGDYSLATDTGLRIQRKTRWTNDHSTYSGDFSNSRPASLDDAQDIVSAMHNTVWGDLMMEVVEEEQGNKGL